jgi:hypothetical protein
MVTGGRPNEILFASCHNQFTMSSSSYVPLFIKHIPFLSFPSDTDATAKRDALIESWQYIACNDFSSYAHWSPINATSNELRDPDDNPATIVIVGQVVTDKLTVDPLGNYQSQTDKQQRYQNSDSKNTRDYSCVNAKQVIVMRRPTPSLWKSDYDTATGKLDALQEKVAKTKAPRQHLLDKDQDPPFVRVSFPLWEKKVDSPFPFSILA